MHDTKIRLEKSPLRVSIASAAVALVTLLLAGYAPLSAAGQSSHATFESAEAASQALFLAVQNPDERALTDILGAGSELISSDDEVQDKLDRERFVQKYRQMHRLAAETHGVMLLYIGAENWPFPIPLVSRNGRWRFDADAGMQEMRFRRIGENEVTAIAFCHMLAAAQRNPRSADSPDGLTAAVLTSAESGNQPVAFHGYYFHILPGARNGFAAIAYPAAYRSSGVMTFFINRDEVVREKDLGPKTARIASTMAIDEPDSTWMPAETP